MLARMSQPERTDVLVVGARCAGAVLALHLRRKKKRVIVVDSCTMPSDQPLSTHFIGTHGMALLDELGVGDKIRAFAPPIPRIKNGIDDAIADVEFPAGRGGSCPRRLDLDPLLVNEARAAGADVRLRTKLVDIVRDRGRVVGGIVESDGKRYEIRADVVVGADGRNSTVADKVGAKEYYAGEIPRAAYWAYWPRPADYATDPRYRGAAAIIHHGEDYFIVFPTNTDQILVGIVFPRSRIESFRGRHEEELLRRLRAEPFTAPLASGEPLGDVVGILKAREFFRDAAGPGWALVGDAGLHKDPAPGFGITDALRDVKALAEALDVGTDEALDVYWRERDVKELELFFFAKNLGALDYNNPLNKVLFGKIAKRPDLRDRIVRVQAREISPFAVFSMKDILRYTAGALLRGNVGVVKPFLEAGKNGKAVAAELAMRERLAEEARAAAARAKPTSVRAGAAA
jgi:menaquinone-9 beta-reductase